MKASLARLLERLSRCERLLLALDFDGTMVPLFLGHHGSPKSPASQRRLLDRLSRSEDVSLAFASGRGLADLRSRIGVRRAAYIGNHGLEAEDGAWRWKLPAAVRARPKIAALARALESPLLAAPGADLEDKGLSLSLHFRAVKKTSAVRRLEKAVNAELAKTRGALRVLHGKKVWNLKPKVRWDKGRALLRWRKAKRLRGTLVFLGDDKTDEEGFRSLGRRAVNVKIGPGPTSAPFRLAQRDVQKLLKALADRRRRR